MYASQVSRLVSALKGIVPRDDVESVDAFEGRESDGVILSLVRSNDRAAIGFLNDPNRVNVAISRAKKLLVIVGDSKRSEERRVGKECRSRRTGAQSKSRRERVVRA